VAIYRKVGYKMGQWRDVGWWHLVLQPETGDPPAPVPIGEIRDLPAARAAVARGESLVRV